MLLNSVFVVFWVRKKYRLDTSQANTLRKKLTRTGYVIFGLFILALFIGISTPALPVSQSISEFIANHGLLVYCAWSFMVTVIAGTISNFLGFPIFSGNTS